MSGTVVEVIPNERLVTSNVLELNGITDFNSLLDVAFAEHAAQPQRAQSNA